MRKPLRVMMALTNVQPTAHPLVGRPLDLGIPEGTHSLFPNRGQSPKQPPHRDTTETGILSSRLVLPVGALPPVLGVGQLLFFISSATGGTFVRGVGYA